LLWAEGSQVKVIEEAAFEGTQLKQLMIPGSLQYIGARICPATTKLLLPRGAKKGMFEEWRALLRPNRDKVMVRRTFRELEDEGNGGVQRTRDKMNDGGEGRTRPTGDEMQNGGESEIQRTKCCVLQ
jgi:hypothetical protein